MNQLLADQAHKWLGKEETTNNSGFKDNEFEKKMKHYGWAKGWAWCAVFTELVWREVYNAIDHEVDRELSRLCHPSAVRTYQNFEEDDSWVVSDEPVVGAIAIWQSVRNGKKSWTGHAGIVYSINEARKVVKCIEGNGSVKGSREGTTVVDKDRDYSTKAFEVDNGLRLLGFIHPKT